MPLLGGGLWGCISNLNLLSSFLLFRTRFMRYLMAFWCMYFMRVLMVDFMIFS